MGGRGKYISSPWALRKFMPSWQCVCYVSEVYLKPRQGNFTYRHYHHVKATCKEQHRRFVWKPKSVSEPKLVKTTATAGTTPCCVNNVAACGDAHVEREHKDVSTKHTPPNRTGKPPHTTDPAAARKRKGKPRVYAICKG